jgi:hypothetical protein
MAVCDKPLRRVDERVVFIRTAPVPFERVDPRVGDEIHHRCQAQDDGDAGVRTPARIRRANGPCRYTP